MTHFRIAHTFADTFADSLARLTGEEQKLVRTTTPVINHLRMKVFKV